jgi:cell division protease FtsH
LMAFDDIIEDMKFWEKMFKKTEEKVATDKIKKGNNQKKETKNKKKAKKDEFLKNLPPGVKVTKIELGPKQFFRLIIYMVLIYWIFSLSKDIFLPVSIEKVPLSQSIEAVKKGQVEEIVVTDNEIMFTLKEGDKTFSSSKEPASSMVEILQKEEIDLDSVNFRVENRAEWKMLVEAGGLLLSIGIPILFILWFFRKQAGGSGGVMGFSKSKAKLFIKGKQSTNFKDVAGVEEAKRDLEEIVDFLKHPDKYKKVGARPPKGVLLVGPSGVGKTLLAKAVAGEANVPFYSMAGSEFMEMLVGVGASRVRDLFGTAKKAGKAIIFIDEIDAIGRARGGIEGGNGEREQTLNQILVEMDGFEPTTTVVVLAATNRGDLLDSALMRPGRFDRRVVLEMPDLEARKGIIKIHSRKKPFVENIDWQAVAKRTVGFSGADLENMMNEAAIAVARNNRSKITMEDIEEAALKAKLGSAKKRTQTNEDKLMTAYHEAGHAIVNYFESLDPVTRISIVSRGMALGFTLIPPERDIIHQTKSKLIKQMAMAMGGRAAESIQFGDISTGASSDINRATEIARSMVIEWGMSELGPVNLGPMVSSGSWNKYMEVAKISDQMQLKVDTEIFKLVNTAYERAVEILKKNKKKLDELAKVLVEKETLGREDFEKVMKDK